MQTVTAALLVMAAGTVQSGYIGRGAGIGIGLGVGRGIGIGGAGLIGRGHGVGYGKAIVDYAEPRPYHYQYAVDDPQYGPMFNKAEESDGAGNVQGSYAVNLPDGRTQIVKYVADHYNGFNAEVSYAGYAQHPQVARGYGYGPIGGVGIKAVKGVGLRGGIGIGGGYGRIPIHG